MAESRDPLPLLSPEDVERLCACNGTALCGEAQADGVPCGALGRQCEHCGRAVELLRAIEPRETDPDDDTLQIVPTEIGA
jgi:hypothetical protein